MTSNRRVAVCLLAGLILVLVLLHVPRAPEPAFHGQPLSRWLRECHTNYFRPRLETIAAVQSMGTNALPRLRVELRTRDSQLKLIAVDFIKKHKLLRIAPTPASTRCCVAAELCQALGPKAQAALPELAKLLASGDQRCRIECIQALSAIGPPAFSTLTNALTDRDGNVRVFAIQAVAKFGAPAWPWLTNALSDNVPMARICAAGGLSKAGPEALIRCLQDQDLMVRRSAASALGNLGSRASAAKPALVRALEDSNFEVRFQAGEALRRIDPLWKSESLTRVITEAERLVADPTKDRDLRRNTAWLLERLSERPLQPSPLLRNALLGDNQRLLDLRVEALYATNWPSSVRVEFLAGLVGYQQDYNVGIAAAEALGKMGRAASNACTALETALQDDWPFVRASAAKALGRIGLPRDRVIGLIEGALHDESTQVQVEAAAALWELGAADAKEIRPVLVQGLGHKLTRVKERATEVLEQMKTPTPASP